jgi:subtilisin family serine protease
MRTPSLVLLACLAAVGAVATGADAAPAAPAQGRYIVIAPNKAAFNSALSDARSGTRVALTLAPVNAFVVTASPAVAHALGRLSGAAVVPDRIESLEQPGSDVGTGWADPADLSSATAAARLTALRRTANPFAKPAATPFGILSGFTPDPAFGLGPPDPMWNVEHIGAPAAWATNGGDDGVVVAVEDTGLDYTHDELSGKVTAVADFTTTENPQLCKDVLGFGFGDADVAADMSLPQDLDFNGHGSSIGGVVAAAVDGDSLNGVAPGVSLVSLKIAQWCGSTYDSEIIAGLLWAADHDVDVVAAALGNYLDRSKPAEKAIYDLYGWTVKYATARGTTVVAAAGNEHARIGTGGKVLSHGVLSFPPGGEDFIGLYEVPGGITGVVDVSATANVVNAAAATCPEPGSTTGDRPWCKPLSDGHQPFGAGLEDQLAYYSNYGSRIDVAAPGGSRKFNLPTADRGGSEGWPFTGAGSYASGNNPGGGESAADGFAAWQDFTITSNSALVIPCVSFDGTSTDPSDPANYYGVPTRSGFDHDQCYTAMQGTSMAVPHVAAVLALIAGAHPELAGQPAKLVKFLKSQAVTPLKSLVNATPPLSATDVSNTDLSNSACPGGYCHLGGKAIKAKEAFGAGLVNAAKAVAGGAAGP